MFYTTDDLVAAAKRSEFFPVSQSTFTDPDDLIAFANEEMMMKVVPLILSEREDYFLTTLTRGLVSSVNHYALPERAIGNNFKDIFYLPNKTDLTNKYTLSKIQVHELSYGFNSQTVPARFHLQGDEVVIVPTPTSLSGTEGILFYYFQRPSKLVSVSSCAKITGVSSAAGTTTFTVNTDLTGSISVGTNVDFLSGKSPFRNWATDVPVTAITATTIAVATANVQDESGAVEPISGDYISLAQQACIPMIPQEFHPILSELVCYRAMKALGATEHLQVLAANIKDMMQNALKLMSNRVESEVDVVYDRDSILNTMKFYGNRAVLK